MGPWTDLSAYCDGLIDTGLSRLPPVDPIRHDGPPYRGSVETHVNLLTVGRDVIHALSKDPRIINAAAPTLYHPDLHKRNIFVSDDDPTIVTGFIDWQSSSIEPAFVYADEMPDFATSMPPSEDEPADINAELCRQAFNVCLQCLVPKIWAARALDDDLLRPFRYCHRTWRDGAVAFRQELIEISNRWRELKLTNSCPYVLPTSDELLIHQKDFGTFETAQNLKRRLACLLDTAPDGWVPTHLWEATKVAHKEAFNEVVLAVKSESAGGQSMSEEDLKEIWPFDINKEY